MKYSTILFSDKPCRDLSLIFKDSSYQGLKYLETKSRLYIKLFTLTQSVSLDLKIHTPGCRFSPVPHCCCLVTQSCLTLCDPMDCCMLGSSVHGMSQARTLEWVPSFSSRGSSWPRDQTCISCIGRHILYH